MIVKKLTPESREAMRRLLADIKRRGEALRKNKKPAPASR
jgi:hypothetical protein